MSIAAGCNNIRLLDFSFNPIITSVGVIAIAESCPGLIHLKLMWCRNLGNLNFAKLSERCLNLQILDLSICSGIIDLTLFKIRKSVFFHLKWLDLSSCVNIGDLSITLIEQNCNGLKHSICQVVDILVMSVYVVLQISATIYNI